MARRLKPITGEGTKKENRFGVCDIEVSEWVNFLCIGYYDGHSDVYRWFASLDSFLDFVFKHCTEHGIDSIFAHFGGKFDFNFILRAALSSKKYTIGSMIPRGSSILCFDLVKIEKGSKIKDWQKVTFRDSSALLPFALRTLTETFDVPVKKGQIDYEKMGAMWKTKKGKQDILDYLKDDCVGLWQVLNAFYSQPMIEKAGKTFTTASQALRVFQTYMPKGSEILSLPDKVDTFIRKAYFGGRTEVFKPVFDTTYNIKKNPNKFPANVLKELERQKKIGKLFYVDVNSLFPFCMWKFDFPTRAKYFSVSRKDYDPKGLGFWEVTVKVPKDLFCPPLGIKHEINGNEKLVFATGTFRGRWTIAEIEYAKSIGVKVLKYHKGVILDNGGRIFKTYVADLYKKRLEAKNRGDEATSMLVKLMMNSTYGKFGQTMKDKESIVLDEGQEGITPHSEIKVKGSKNVVRFATKKKDIKHGFANVGIAAYVTAYSRIHMHKLYMKAGKKHLFYTDTDSLFTSKPFPNGEKLGQLKLEYTCTSACFLLPKTYINEGVVGEKFEKKVTMKGFDKKKIKHFGFNDFKDCLYGDMTRLGIIQKPKFATLKTALRKGEFVCMAFDPATEEKVAIKKIGQLKSEQTMLESAVKVTNEDKYKKRLTKTKGQIRALEKKVNEGFIESTRSIKSKYDKRICSPDGFFSDPIHIVEKVEQ